MRGDSIVDFFDELFDQYYRNNDDVSSLLDKFAENDMVDIVNDHVAFRTFDFEEVNLEKLAEHFTSKGYQECGEYYFEDKKLHAKHYECGTHPKVFISELQTDKISFYAKKTLKKLIDEIPKGVVEGEEFLYSGIEDLPWNPISYFTYLKLKEESEYAAWVATFGYCANHFTVSINKSEVPQDIYEFNEMVKSWGFKLNSVGGEVKGTPEDLLEQSSTMANNIEVEFSDRKVEIPYCFYEFAKRYDGFDGFLAKNADKIFESTNSQGE